MIDVVPLRNQQGQLPDPALLGLLLEPLQDRFGKKVRIVEPMRTRKDFYSESRRQWRSDLLLVPLSTHTLEGSRWSLGVMDDDLYTPGLNFVFGQARRGAAGVIGLARFREEWYQGTPDEGKFQHRVITTALHEIGHVAGLDHCPDPACGMRFSYNVTHTDAKGSGFCQTCMSILDSRLGPVPQPSRAPAREVAA